MAALSEVSARVCVRRKQAQQNNLVPEKTGNNEEGLPKTWCPGSNQSQSQEGVQGEWEEVKLISA